MKNLLILLFILLTNMGFSQMDSSEWRMPPKPMTTTIHSKAAPVNDNCTSATPLTIDGGLDCNGTTFDATLQGGECYTNYGGGASEHTVWYSFTANNDSLVFAFNKTNYTNCQSPHVRIYGANVGCLPACGTEIYNDLHNGDPGQHTLLTGLTVGATYLIQVQDLDCGGPNDGHVEFCIGMFTPPVNNTASGAEGIDSCGQVYNGTNIGYTPEDLTPGLDNLDGNLGTTCPTCGTAGDDVPYVVNNSSWFSFCASAAGTYTIDFNGITNCQNAAPNYGLQMTIFRGTPTNLTVIQHAPSPSAPGSSWTSMTFSVAAGECIYLVVDGFAGDQCDYSYTLNNISGGCNLVPLPVELEVFDGYHENGVNKLYWVTTTEVNNDYFTIERSRGGTFWEELGTVQGMGNSNNRNEYYYNDDSYVDGINYYKLTQTDFDGNKDTFRIVSINTKYNINNQNYMVINLFGQEVSKDYNGIRVIVYEDGRRILIPAGVRTPKTFK
jgi:hypothetical protein